MLISALCCERADPRPSFVILNTHALTLRPVDVRLGNPAHLGGQQPRGASAGVGRRVGAQWPCRNGFTARAYVPAADAKNFCANTTAHRRRERRILFLQECRQIFAWNGARCRYSAPAKFPIRSWKRKFAAPTPNFCASLPRCTRHIRKIIWSTRAGFRLEGRRAVVLLPHWNSDALAYNSLCRVLNWLGIAVLRLSMPYHDIRRPAEIAARRLCRLRQHRPHARRLPPGRDRHPLLPGLARSSKATASWASWAPAWALVMRFSPPRTIRAFGWRLSITLPLMLPTWSGMDNPRATSAQGWNRRSISTGCAGYGAAVSPMSYFKQFARWPKKVADHLCEVRSDISAGIFAPGGRRIRAHNLDHKVVVLPCGHYTTGETPYKYMDGWHLASVSPNGI